MKTTTNTNNNFFYGIAIGNLNNFNKRLVEIAKTYLLEIYGKIEKNGKFSNNTEDTTIKAGNTSKKLLLTTSNKNLLVYSELKKVVSIMNKILISNKIDIVCILPSFETLKKSITVNLTFISYAGNKAKFKEIDLTEIKETSNKQAGENKQETETKETETENKQTETNNKFDNKEFEKTCKKLEKIKIDYLVKYLEKNGYTVKKTEKNNIKKVEKQDNKQAGASKQETETKETETKNK